MAHEFAHRSRGGSRRGQLSAEQLKSVPGVDDARAEKIVKNRPYPTRAYLVTKGVYSQEEYYTVKDYFVATPPAKAKK